MKNKEKIFIRLLGPPQISDKTGCTVQLSTQKSLALLAMIATSDDGGLRRDRAATSLWSRSPEAQARTNLRQSLSVIRGALGEDVILSSGGVLKLNRKLVLVDTDAMGVEPDDLRDRISSFGSPFLEGLSINEPLFEEWLLVTRATFSQAVKDLLVDAGNAALAADDPQGALNSANRVLYLDAYEEHGMALCLKALAAKGERSRVQIRFEEFERLLRQDLGIGIGADLTALRQKLLNYVEPPKRRSPKTSVPTVLVFPFKTLSDVPDHRFFAEGLAEDVITQLSKFSTLSVASCQSNISADSTGGPIAQAEEIGADYLLRGSVRWMGTRLRLTVELVQVSTGAVNWAERLDREAPNLFDVQDEISSFLVGAIPYRVESDVAKNAAGKPPDNLEAYELMILGKQLRDSISLEGNLKARGLLERAVKQEPGIARSHMYLSDSYVVQNWLGHLDAKGHETALYHARKAVDLDPFDVHIQDHLGFALLAMGQWDAAESQIRNALSMAENEIESMSWCAYALLMLGNHKEAGDIIEAVAKRRTTLPPTFEWIVGQVFSFQGRHAEVVQTLNGASLLNATGLAFRAGSQARLGMLEEARFTLAEFKEARQRDQGLTGMEVCVDTIETALGGYRRLWRRAKDWEHIAAGLRLAGLPD